MDWDITSDIGLMIEPNIFERPKVIVGKAPTAENKFYSASINIGNMVDGLIQVTASYNHDRNVVRSFNAYDADIRVYSYETGSMISSSGANFSLVVSSLLISLIFNNSFTISLDKK